MTLISPQDAQRGLELSDESIVLRGFGGIRVVENASTSICWFIYRLSWQRHFNPTRATTSYSLRLG